MENCTSRSVNNEREILPDLKKERAKKIIIITSDRKVLVVAYHERNEKAMPLLFHASQNL